MTSLRVKVLAGSVLGLVLIVLAFVLFPRTPREPHPAAAPAAVAAPEPEATPAVPETAAPLRSRSKGDRDWPFFFRPGDTLSRMGDGVPLGVVTRLERSHAFPDGSVGPAYVVRAADQQETVFDADELERRARIDTIRESARPPIGPRPR
jgi:hypothetical protein